MSKDLKSKNTPNENTLEYAVAYFSARERRAKIIENLPSNVNPDVFMNSVITIFMDQRNLQWDKKEVLRCVHEAARDGLVLDKREAAIIPYKNKSGYPVLTYVPMIGGIIKRLLNSGNIAEISVQTVHENDEFDLYETEDGRKMRFRQCLKGDRGTMYGTFCRIKFVNGGVNLEYMTVEEVIKYRPSHAKQDSPWYTHFKEMAKKTVLKRASKYCTMSAEDYRLLSQGLLEEKEEKSPQYQDVTPSKEKPQEVYYEDMEEAVEYAPAPLQEAPPVPVYPSGSLFEDKKELETNAIKSILGFAPKEINDDYGDDN